MGLVWIRIEIRLVHDPTVVIFIIVYDEFIRSSVGYIGKRISTFGVPHVYYDISEQWNFFYLEWWEFIWPCDNIVLQFLQLNVQQFQLEILRWTLFNSDITYLWLCHHFSDQILKVLGGTRTEPSFQIDLTCQHQRPKIDRDCQSKIIKIVFNGRIYLFMFFFFSRKINKVLSVRHTLFLLFWFLWMYIIFKGVGARHVLRSIE